MFKVQLAICAAAVLVAGTAHAQSNEFATGNMHFDARDMDTNGDHMITRDEMIKYAEKQWEMMAHGKDTIPISVAARDFATGGVNTNGRTRPSIFRTNASNSRVVLVSGLRSCNQKSTWPRCRP